MTNNTHRYLSEVELLDLDNYEESKIKKEIIKSAFHDLIESKDLTKFSQIMSPDLRIYKNNEIWDYQKTYTYLKNLISDFQKVEFLPFEMLLISGNYVTLKFTETLYKNVGPATKHRFISIFEISDKKIKNIWELSVEQKTTNYISPNEVKKNEIIYIDGS